MIVQELHKLQAKHGYIPRHELIALGERLALPLYRIQEVVSFFPHYRTASPAELEIHVCQDMACHLRGSTEVIEKLASSFEGELNRVKVCGASCLGRCDRAPAARIYDNRHQQSGEHPVYNLHGRAVAEISTAAVLLLSGQHASHVLNDTDHAWQPPQKDWQIDIYAGKPAADRYASIRWFIQTSTKVFTGTIAADARTAAVQNVLGSLKTAWLLGLGGAGGRAYKKWEE
ncbi:MAG: NAD(P)H-dependent oxidoreductase subunit E, partial [Planctomycetales bacterium]|nr:NAD(P)H-dependent oxidoreductase subunit E [Planctomycetales bacterium]